MIYQRNEGLGVSVVVGPLSSVVAPLVCGGFAFAYS